MNLSPLSTINVDYDIRGGRPGYPAWKDNNDSSDSQDPPQVIVDIYIWEELELHPCLQGGGGGGGQGGGGGGRHRHGEGGDGGGGGSEGDGAGGGRGGSGDGGKRIRILEHQKLRARFRKSWRPALSTTQEQYEGSSELQLEQNQRAARGRFQWGGC